MTKITLSQAPWDDSEERVWKYLLTDKLATAEQVAMNCDVPPEFAQKLIAKIGTPREVFVKEAQLELPFKTTRVVHEDSGSYVEYTAGVKFDGGKDRYDLIPPEIEEAMAKVLTFGAAKYSERNWELGMKWGRPYAALRRHMAAWWKGEDTDPETGMPHTWHAACCIAFIIAFEARGTGTDDRPTKAD